MIFEAVAFEGHEAVHAFHDAAAGLHAIIAIHSTALGPAVGGCRVRPYPTSGDALHDALRLSRAMSFKNALADLPLGGGKAVLIADPRHDKRRDLFLAFGRAVQSLGGCYVTAEDVGTSVEDMTIVAQETSFVAGLPASEGQLGGDPSPQTALGVALGIAEAVRHRLGRSDLEGTSVAVQGLGKVGFALCEELSSRGCTLQVADLDVERCRSASERFGALVLDTDSILTADVDVLAPCALGGAIDALVLPRLRATIVAGAANNPLSMDLPAGALRARRILYAPDYAINAGGIINVAYEYLGGTKTQLDEHVRRIPQTLREIFERADREDRSTREVADEMAQDRIAEARRPEVVQRAPRVASS